MTIDLLHNLTLGDILREHRRSWPTKVGIVDGTTRLTYPQLDDRVNRLGHSFAAAGVGQGDCVLWMGQNSFRLIEALLAAAKIGALLCPANWRQSAEELAFVIEDLSPKVILWQEEEVGDNARAARKALDDSELSNALSPNSESGDLQTAAPDPLWLQVDAGETGVVGEGTYEAFLASGSEIDDFEPVADSLPVLEMFTAAFTGRPSGALLSHRAAISQGLVLGKLSDIDHSYVYLNAGPLFHVATFMTTLATFVWAGTNVFIRRSEAEETCRVIEAEGCTGAFLMGPTIAEILVANKDHKYNLKSLRAFRGSPEWNEMVSLDESPWARKPAGFGQTEVMGMLSFNAMGDETIGNAGRPSPLVQVRIVDPEGNDVPIGEPGEIVARGWSVMNGYFNRPEENEKRLAGGWHHTNDLGRREIDGTLSFVGPMTRIIKSAAENIYPAEVEACINQHPAVQQSAVIGVPDKQWGQSVKALVLVRRGESVTAEEIIEHCRDKIASYKKPRIVEFLPKPLGWPTDYDALDAAYGGGGYPGQRRKK